MPDSWSDLVKGDHPLPRLGCWAQALGSVFWTFTYFQPETVGVALPGHGLLPILSNDRGFQQLVPAAAG